MRRIEDHKIICDLLKVTNLARVSNISEYGILAR